ncbi:MAG: SpoIIE family protein phosphatase [Coleofasciculaceae cyanobacterium]
MLELSKNILASGQSAQPDNHALRKDSPLILVVDDDRFIRMLLRQLLEQDGYQVEEAENGEQCLTAYAGLQPDMILLDAMMPVMDGFTCCSQLQTLEEGNGIPVLMITGLNDQESVDRAFEAGATDYLTKPIHPPVLRRRLRRLLEAISAQEALRRSEKKYRSVVNNLKEIIYQTDTAGRLTFLNPAWTEVTGFSLEESLGNSFLQFIHPDERLLHWQQFQSLIQGQTAENCYQIRFLTKNGSFGWAEVCTTLTSAESDTTVGTSGTLNDITARKRREQHLSAEHATTRVLADSATLKEVIPKILEVICHSLGWERGEFWSLDQQNNRLHCQESWHLHFFQDPEFETETAQLNLKPGVGLPGHVWATSQPTWITDLAKEAGFCRAKMAAKVGLHTVFGFPILAGDEKLGVITFFSREIQPPDADLLTMMAAIGGQIGQFIKRKQVEEELQRQNLMLQSELNQAADYVRSLLPPPLTEPIAIEQQFTPSLQLGGDIFDYYWLDSNHLVLYLLDVAGHGVRPALLSVSVLNLLRTQSLYNTDFYQPWTVLAELNRLFQIKENGDEYFTIWYGVYNRLKQQLIYSCAGHPPALLLSQTTKPTSARRLSTRSLPIGMLPEAKYKDNTCQIIPGSTLYIFSDGVYEIRQLNSEVWGLNTFIDFLTDHHQNSNGDLEQVLHHIQNLNRNQALDDDFSLLKINLN